MLDAPTHAGLKKVKTLDGRTPAAAMQSLLSQDPVATTA